MKSIPLNFSGFSPWDKIIVVAVGIDDVDAILKIGKLQNRFVFYYYYYFINRLIKWTIIE